MNARIQGSIVDFAFFILLVSLKFLSFAIGFMCREGERDRRVLSCLFTFERKREFLRKYIC